MNPSNNIVKVYQTLRKICIGIPEYDPRKAGFTEALFLLKTGLKECPQFNHTLAITDRDRAIERLREAVSRKNIMIDDLEEDMEVYKKNLQACQKQLGEAIKALKETKIKGVYNDNYKKLEVTVNGYQVNFDCQISEEEFFDHLEPASAFALNAKIRKHPQNTIKCRLMEYFRAQGFKCKAA